MKKSFRSALPRKPMPLFMLILLDLALIGIALLVFAYFHHVRPVEEVAVGITSSRAYGRPTVTPVNTPKPTCTPVLIAVFNTATEGEANIPLETPTATAAPKPTCTPVLIAVFNTATEGEANIPLETPAATATPEPTPEPTPDPVGYFGSIHKDKFTDGEVISERDRYVSENVSVTVTKHKENGTIYHLADIYVRDITSFRTLFAEDKFGKGYSESTYKADLRSDSILTISGDFYGLRNYGVIVRNGTLYRTMKSAICDWCVLYWDGTMECYRPGPVDADAIIKKGAYQSWYFGPMLLDENGQPMTTFNSNVEKRNPRCAIGYFEPGHYCFIVVEGRTDKSKGLSLYELSNLMYSLGCKAAYNLDGGETAQMVFDDRTQNTLLNNGRKCSDFVIITEPTFD